MRTTIDKAGRVVIPRQLRARLGIAEGGTVDIELDGAAIRIEPVPGDSFVEEDGLLLIPPTGSTLHAETVRELIDADRFRR